MPTTTSVLVAVADAVAAALNAADFSLEFAAERAYLTVSDLSEEDGLVVTVLPAGYTVTALDLTPRHAFDCEIEVWVARRTVPTNEAIDPLMGLVAEVVALFGGVRLPGYPSARCTGIANRPAVERGDLDEFRLFASLVTLTFRVTR